MLLSHQQGLCLFSKPDVPKASAACHSWEAVFRGCVTAPSDDVASGDPEPVPHQGRGGAQHEGVGAGNAPPIFQSWGETSRKNPKHSRWKQQREQTAGRRDSRGRGRRAARCPACGGQNLCGAYARSALAVSASKPENKSSRRPHAFTHKTNYGSGPEAPAALTSQYSFPP